jgi:hypothetical protein
MATAESFLLFVLTSYTSMFYCLLYLPFHVFLGVPKSLKSLCRLNIRRQCTNESMPLMKALGLLKLPTPLKDYLQCPSFFGWAEYMSGVRGSFRKLGVRVVYFYSIIESLLVFCWFFFFHLIEPSYVNCDLGILLWLRTSWREVSAFV